MKLYDLRFCLFSLSHVFSCPSCPRVHHVIVWLQADKQWVSPSIASSHKQLQELMIRPHHLLSYTFWFTNGFMLASVRSLFSDRDQSCLMTLTCKVTCYMWSNPPPRDCRWAESSAQTIWPSWKIEPFSYSGVYPCADPAPPALLLPPPQNVHSDISSV